jgi:hypothetical protein
MKTIPVLGLLACVLLFSSVTNAGITTVRDTLDHTDNLSGAATYYFWPPDEIIDHPPFYRNVWEDWGWTHDLTGRVPADANGIQNATLSILAWDVDVDDGEVDIVYVNNVRLGELQGPPDQGSGDWTPPAPGSGQPNGLNSLWSTTSFTLPPVVLQELLQNGKLDVFLDIDRYDSGDRVTLRSSTLEVDYVTPVDGPDPDATADPNVAVHRFWSPVLSGHFYTISQEEMDVLINQFAGTWNYEGIAYHAFGAALDPDLMPVYRFWSDQLGTHFYTISEEERDNVINQFAYVWTYEGVAFYAYPEGQQPPEALPVYRFWSNILSKHFYTISEEEMQKVIDEYSYTWGFEGIAWYAYE